MTAEYTQCRVSRVHVPTSTERSLKMVKRALSHTSYQDVFHLLPKHSIPRVQLSGTGLSSKADIVYNTTVTYLLYARVCMLYTVYNIHRFPVLSPCTRATHAIYTKFYRY